MQVKNRDLLFHVLRINHQSRRLITLIDRWTGGPTDKTTDITLYCFPAKRVLVRNKKVIISCVRLKLKEMSSSQCK